MNANNPNQQPIDPELKRRLQQMRAVPPRNRAAAARGRAKFIAEVNETFNEQGYLPNTPLTGETNFRKRLKEKWIMATPRTRIALTFVTAFVVIAVFLFGGAGMTVYASQTALPGEALYSVKTGVEQTRVNLARDAAQKARLNLAFAERRLDEIARLIDNGDYANVAQPIQEYEKYVQSAIAALETVAIGDAASAQALASQVIALLERYAETLSGMVGALPDPARNEVEHAIINIGNMRDEFEFDGTVEAINADSWVIGGQILAITAGSEIEGDIKVGDLVEVEFIRDANGNLILRDVELKHDLDDDLEDHDDDLYEDDDDLLDDDHDDLYDDDHDDLYDDHDDDKDDLDDAIDNDDDHDDNDDLDDHEDHDDDDRDDHDDDDGVDDDRHGKDHD